MWTARKSQKVAQRKVTQAWQARGKNGLSKYSHTQSTYVATHLV
jgi:hypothetical protein